MATECTLLELGRVDYGEAWELQKRLVDGRFRGVIGDTLILLEHPHVYTLGRNADPSNVLCDQAGLARLGASIYRIDRGGDVTYHGPGQLVGYPILDLRLRGSDVHRYVRDLEEVIIRALADYGVGGGREPGYSGVWVGDEKVAAIGVRVSRWVSSHGFALNVCPDLGYFSHIIPCGIRDRGVTSLTKLTRSSIGLPATTRSVARHFAEVFGCTCREGALGDVDRLIST